jgi:hypothetical protein
MIPVRFGRSSASLGTIVVVRRKADRHTPAGAAELVGRRSRSFITIEPPCLALCAGDGRGEAGSRWPFRVRCRASYHSTRRARRCGNGFGPATSRGCWAAGRHTLLRPLFFGVVVFARESRWLSAFMAITAAMPSAMMVYKSNGSEHGASPPASGRLNTGRLFRGEWGSVRRQHRKLRREQSDR